MYDINEKCSILICKWFHLLLLPTLLHSSFSKVNLKYFLTATVLNTSKWNNTYLRIQYACMPPSLLTHIGGKCVNNYDSLNHGMELHPYWQIRESGDASGFSHHIQGSSLQPRPTHALFSHSQLPSNHQAVYIKW